MICKNVIQVNPSRCAMIKWRHKVCDLIWMPFRHRRPVPHFLTPPPHRSASSIHCGFWENRTPNKQLILVAFARPLWMSIKIWICQIILLISLFHNIRFRGGCLARVFFPLLWRIFFRVVCLHVWFRWPRIRRFAPPPSPLPQGGEISSLMSRYLSTESLKFY